MAIAGQVSVGDIIRRHQSIVLFFRDSDVQSLFLLQFKPHVEDLPDDWVRSRMEERRGSGRA